jgi:putative oxidoreductase
MIAAGSPFIGLPPSEESRRHQEHAMTFAFPATWSPRLRSILRIVVGLMFMLHGAQKLLGFPDAAAKLQPHAPALLKAAGIIELVGGALIAVGLFTSVAALIASGEMAVAYFKQHAPGGFWPTLTAESWRCCTASCSSTSPSPVRDRGRSTHSSAADALDGAGRAHDRRPPASRVPIAIGVNRGNASSDAA